MFDIMMPIMIPLIIIAICTTIYFIIDRICEMEEEKAFAKSEKDFDEEE